MLLMFQTDLQSEWLPTPAAPPKPRKPRRARKMPEPAKPATVGRMQDVTLTPANEDDYVFVARPSKWGNPYRSGQDGTKEEVVAHYRAHLRTRPDLMTALPTLFGKVLLCWCEAGTPCHARVLAEEANKLFQQTQQREEKNRD